MFYKPLLEDIQMALKPTSHIVILRTLNILVFFPIYFANILLLSGFPANGGDGRLG